MFVGQKIENSIQVSSYNFIKEVQKSYMIHKYVFFINI